MPFNRPPNYPDQDFRLQENRRRYFSPSQIQYNNNRKSYDYEDQLEPKRETRRQHLLKQRKHIETEVVDEVIKIDKKLKSICKRGHNPTEVITQKYYKRTFNINGYKTETATVRIKHTVLYSCLDPVIEGRPCLEDVALLPEDLIIDKAEYSIENNKLTIEIPFKENSIFMDSNVCRTGDIDETVMIVSKKRSISNNSYNHKNTIRNHV
ncbi:jg14951 [Pararge aegeria aegeria]|uniref:Jg14951 protein n=1 Tax=Pararge aegeria aegeria TaxID=348720 RepID=A0A8S4SCJ5_9NEOP|nr:jg14951 [Pararge aegeria aegeria]